jgi:hypothetical protein
MVDMVPMPMFFWARNGTLVDSHANAGFVAEGIDRDAFDAAAIRHLTGRYLYGSVIDDADSPSAGPHTSSPSTLAATSRSATVPAWRPSSIGGGVSVAS